MIGRTLALAGVLTAIAVPAMAGAAYADPPPHNNPPQQSQSHNPTHDNPTHGNPPQHMPPSHNKPSVTAVVTRVRDAHISNRPGTDRHNRVVGTLRMRGARVLVTCYTSGDHVAGNSVWYKTVSPARGYISAAAVTRPTHRVDRCN